ncbi:MAG TPA: RNA-directed DNA polymerase [Candidatus Contendobacter sp.]|nr:RNA-directed DNA polymerase [Candidatus Competibacteraceae bacterium]HRZ07772.1 RNA-directed DNA polymerase [Candidatus Competibacteraceae bacterium]HRZ53614.1 RNA-directed DNA polymerase [Candidatus Contendobacter sp.]
MKRLRDLWPQLIAFDNLWRAWRQARRGKSRSTGAVAFELNLERELLALQRELTDGSYQPGGYRLFTLYERKPRLIAAAPFRDRVVHHAVMNIIEPPLDRTFIFDSYACRQGKGTHAAVDRYQRWAQRYPYVLKLDVRRYFPSMDHALLKAKLRRRIADPRVVALLDQIIDGSPADVAGDPIYFPGDNLLTPAERRRGIPIGNLTSQFFANLYLDDLDHWLKEQCRVPAYLRYVDDLVLLADVKTELHDHHAALADYLSRERLRLHPRKAQVSRTGDGLNLLGYLVFPHRRRLRNDNGLRFRRRLRQFARAYAQGRLCLADINPSVQAWLGHARHADTFGLCQSIFNAVSFTRGADR